MTGLRDWTTKDEDFLLKNYARLGPGGCASRLGRTRETVIERAHMMRRRGVNVPYLRRPMDDEELEQIKCMWEAGKTIPQIAWKMDLKEKRVYSCLSKMQLWGDRSPRWTQEDEKELKAMLASGWPHRLIAAALGRTEGAVRSRIYNMKEEDE